MVADPTANRAGRGARGAEIGQDVGVGLGYTLFVKPLVTVAIAVVGLSAVYLLPEYWPDHAIASDAILRDDAEALRRYLARGLDPEERAQWRFYLRRTMGRTTRVGVGGSMPPIGAAEQSLLSYALGTCKTGPARQLVEAGADTSRRGRDGFTLLGRSAGCGGAELVGAMLAAGASATAEEPDGGTVLWEPTNVGWRRRPFEPGIVGALEGRGAARPARAPVRQ